MSTKLYTLDTYEQQAKQNRSIMHVKARGVANRNRVAPRVLVNGCVSELLTLDAAGCGDIEPISDPIAPHSFGLSLAPARLRKVSTLLPTPCETAPVAENLRSPATGARLAPMNINMDAGVTG